METLVSTIAHASRQHTRPQVLDSFLWLLMNRGIDDPDTLPLALRRRLEQLSRRPSEFAPSEDLLDQLAECLQRYSKDRAARAAHWLDRAPPLRCDNPKASNLIALRAGAVVPGPIAPIPKPRRSDD